jgi:hypothetical protein
MHLQDLPAFEAASMSSIEDDDSSGASDGEGAGEGPSPLELRCVLAVVRHGDRTPKQKMKMTVSQVRLVVGLAVVGHQGGWCQWGVLQAGVYSGSLEWPLPAARHAGMPVQC